MERTEKALAHFDNNFNCSQSVLVAFAEDLGLSEDEALRVASAFGGGIGRQQFTCGALTGASMVLGLKFGKGKNDPDEKKIETYEKVVRLFNEFSEVHKSTNCRALLHNLDMNDEKELEIINGQNLFHDLCRKYVADAVQIVERITNQ